MSSLRIEILNPKALRLLESLAELDLITIREDHIENKFVNLLESLRIHAGSAPSLEEIAEEVKIVRAERYGK